MRVDAMGRIISDWRSAWLHPGAFTAGFEDATDREAMAVPEGSERKRASGVMLYQELHEIYEAHCHDHSLP